jgi:hypothetical protein
VDERTCPVVFSNGTRCPRPIKGTRWCQACYMWSRTNGWADPSGRTAYRRNSELQAKLQMAATATTDECLILSTPSGRRPKADFNGSVIWASRAVWIIANGDPGDLWVLHSCHRGDEGCINIRHLYLGDHEQNMQDREDAGRTVRGEQQWKSILSAGQVTEMRAAYIPRVVTQAVLAERYGVSKSHVAQILCGMYWEHVSSD